VPTTDDAAGLWDLWVGQGGGEGIVLKDPASIYRPGLRSPGWLKVKAKLTLDVTVTGGDPSPIAWGDWGLAVRLEFTYPHPRTAVLTAATQAVRISRDEPFELRADARAEVVCWGVMPSGMLRHPLFVRWL